MNLSIRRARESDRKQFDWQPYWGGDRRPTKPWVVAVDGEVFVAFGANREVVFQNGTESVAELVRVALRYFDAMGTLRGDLVDLRLDRRSAETRRRYQAAMSRAAGRDAADDAARHAPS